MGIAVIVTNPTARIKTVQLTTGERLVFGRSQRGVGQISKHDAVSALHGAIEATASGFDVTSTGSQMGFSVIDRTTPSRLLIPRGVGPVAVPFADCSIIVEYRHGRDYLDVAVTGSSAADRWASSWGPEIRERWAAADPNALATQPPWPTQPWRKSNGRPYAWFGTLVELCKPALREEPAGIPNNAELARRLHLSNSAVERHMTAIYVAFDLEHECDREVAVRLAVDHGIVTRADLGTP